MKTKYLSILFLSWLLTACSQKKDNIYQLEQKLIFKSIASDTVNFYSNKKNTFIASIDNNDAVTMMMDYKNDFYISQADTTYTIVPLWSLNRKDDSEAYALEITPTGIKNLIAGYTAEKYLFSFKSYGEEQTASIWVTKEISLKNIFYPFDLKNHSIEGFCLKTEGEGYDYELISIEPTKKQISIPIYLLETTFFKTRKKIINEYEDYSVPKVSNTEVNNYLEEFKLFYLAFFTTWSNQGPATAESFSLGRGLDSVNEKMPREAIRNLPKIEMDKVLDFYKKTQDLHQNLIYIVKSN